MNRRFYIIACLVSLLASFGLAQSVFAAAAPAAVQFPAFDNGFVIQNASTTPGQVVLGSSTGKYTLLYHAYSRLGLILSPVERTIPFATAQVSWDASVPATAAMTVFVRGSYDGTHWTQWQIASTSGNTYVLSSAELSGKAFVSDLETGAFPKAWNMLDYTSQGIFHHREGLFARQEQIWSQHKYGPIVMYGTFIPEWTYTFTGTTFYGKVAELYVKQRIDGHEQVTPIRAVLEGSRWKFFVAPGL